MPASAELIGDQSVDEAVAFDGTNHLVVWAGTPGRGLRASRFDPSGQALDRRPLQLTDRLPDATNFPGGPQLAATYDGRNYLVVWATGDGEPSDLRGARVSTDGRVLDPGGFPIADSGPDDGDPAVAFDGTHSVVVWRGGDAGDAVLAVRIDGEGRVVDPEPLRVAEHGDEPTVAPAGTELLVAWRAEGGLRSARLDRGGTVVPAGGRPLPSGPGARSPAVAFDGANGHVAWIEEDGSDRSFRVVTTRIGPAGDVLDPEPVTVAGGLPGAFALAAAPAGEHVMLAWDAVRTPETEIAAARVDRSGRVLDPAGIVLHRGENTGVRVRLAPGAGHVLAAFSKAPGDPCCTTLGRRIAHDGALADLAPFPLSLTGAPQQAPKVASDGTTHLAVWVESPGESRQQLVAARMDASGALDRESIVLGRYERVVLHAVAFDGSSFVVAFSVPQPPPTGGLYFALLSPSGELRQPWPSRISEVGPAADGTLSIGTRGTLLAWSAPPGEVRAVVIAPDGAITYGLVPLSPPVEMHLGEASSRPVAAFDGEHHLVVYAYTEGFDDIEPELRGVRVTEEAKAVDAEPLRIMDSPATDKAPALAWNGERFLLAWYGNTFGSAGRSVEAVRLDRQGRVDGPAPFRLSEGAADQPAAVAAVDDGFLVVWSRPGDAGSDVVGLRVDGVGTAPEPGGFLIAEAADSPALTSADGGWVSVYRRPNDVDTGSPRVYSRAIGAP